METDIMEILRGLLSEDETIYEVVRCAAAPIYIIGPIVDDIERKLDVSACIEILCIVCWIINMGKISFLKHYLLI